MSDEQRPKVFPVVGKGEERPPDYDRVVRRLSVAELRSDLQNRRGDDGYRRACRRELERRAADEGGPT